MITPTGVPIAKLILFEVEFGDLKEMYNQESRNVAQARRDQKHTRWHVSW